MSVSSARVSAPKPAARRIDAPRRRRIATDQTDAMAYEIASVAITAGELARIGPSWSRRGTRQRIRIGAVRILGDRDVRRAARIGASPDYVDYDPARIDAAPIGRDLDHPVAVPVTPGHRSGERAQRAGDPRGADACATGASRHRHHPYRRACCSTPASRFPV
jgi:hypothetical protein